MAYSKATFGDLLLSLSYRYGESAIPSSGIENRKYWLNRGVDYIVNKLKPVQSDSITVSSGTCDLSSTASGTTKDFRSFVRLVNSGGTVVPMVRPEQYTNYSSNVCSITGNHSSGFTLNVKTDGTYTLWYRFYPSPMTTNADECIISDPEAVVAYAYAQIRSSETDPLEDVEKSMEECEERIANMAEEISRNEGDLRFVPYDSGSNDSWWDNL